MEYQEYLQSDHWREFRLVAIENADYHCALCNAHDCELHVHHNNYERLWSERLSDVVVLCARCHEKFHDILPNRSGMEDPPPTSVVTFVERLKSVADPDRRKYMLQRQKILESGGDSVEMAKKLVKLREEQDAEAAKESG